MGAADHGRYLTRLAVTLVVVISLVAVPAAPADAQYFGRNKVQYDDFDFRVLHTDHFDIYYYEAEARETIQDFGRMAERWYDRLARTFQHEFEERKPIIVYRNQPDFQQTNAIPGFISQATGGVTESIKNRVVMPLTQSYAETDHVLGHELVHAFQYDLARAASGGGLTAIGRLPLWLVEGLAEYLSLGRVSAQTSLWIRDAVAREDMPGLTDLDNPQEYFPYRWGHAFWAYVAGLYGDDVVGDLYRRAAQQGPRGGIEAALGVPADTLVSAWHRDSREHFLPQLEGRATASDAGTLLRAADLEGGTNLAPELSPNGERMVVLTQNDPFSIDLFVMDARTGEIQGRLASARSSPHFDALAFINTSGGWSPDSRSFAFVTYDEGENEIAVANVDDRSIRRTYSLPGIGAVYGLAWSPDGSEIAFSGSSAGITDLYLLDVESGEVRALTSDRYAEWHPAWSPDGTRLAFATDRGPETDLERLHFQEPGIAILDVATGHIEVRRPLDPAKHTDPAFAPDGTSLYFIANPDGVNDIFRMELASGATFRVTRVATGVSGITDLSPALTVASESGRVAFTVFSDDGYAVVTRPREEAQGERFPARDGGLGAPLAATLPPVQAADLQLVSGYLDNPGRGLPPESPGWEDTRYDGSLALDYIAQPTAGIAVDRIGTTLGGSVAAFFSDMLGNRQLGVGLSVNGRIQDIGAEAVYVDRGSRLNWGLRGGRVPYHTGFTRVGTVDFEGESARAIDLVVNRAAATRAAALFELPLSQTERFEAHVGGTRLGYDRVIHRDIVLDGRVVDRIQLDASDPEPINLATAAVAFVQDNSIFGFTSPVDGSRTRLEVEANRGTFDFVNALADARRYFFADPITVAFRGLHFGRYGADSESPRLQPLYLGQGVFVRGYSIDSFRGEECSAVPGSPNACPEFDRLVGSRIAVANVELRIPLFGTERFGIIETRFLPIELSFFADAGVAWTSEEAPTFALERRSMERTPVASAGGSVRVNVLGRLIAELFYAYPFQRPEAGWQFGFQISPGW